MSAHLDALARRFAEPVSGPSYRPWVRVAAVAMVAVALPWGTWSLLAGEGALTSEQIVAALALAGVLLAPLPGLLFGRTVVDATGIRQLGWMGREIAWAEVRRVRMIRIPLAPRLVASAGLGRARVFHSGCAELDLAFEQAVDALTRPAGDTRA